MVSIVLLRKSLPTDERFQRMEDQLALFIRWRIFFSSFLGAAGGMTTPYIVLNNTTAR
jgi:hypothetical protein